MALPMCKEASCAKTSYSWHNHRYQGSSDFSKFGATSQFKRQKGDMKRISFTNFWHHRTKFSRQGFVHT